MDEEKKIRLWLHYSSIWRKVLTHVLGWPVERVEHHIEELRQQMEVEINDPDTHGFFFDPPSKQIWRAIVDDLYEKTKGNEAGPYAIYQRLDNAMSGGLNHWELDKESFDWSQARQRYQNERRKIEEWLASLQE
jgi:hypothetical protein